MKKIFNKNITWKFIILFSLIIGIVVGIINRIPIIKNTSFQDIAVTFDVWIVFAIYIIVNCKNVKDAVLKTFIFFLISQPVIYLVEALIDTLFYNKQFIDTLIYYIKNYYIGAKWLHWTILVIPGSFIAYQIKKDNILSSIILSVVTCYYSYVGVYNLLLGYHYISSIFCLIMAFLLIFIILSKKKERIISIILTIISGVVAIFMYNKTINTPIMGDYSITTDYEVVSVEVEDSNIATASIDEYDGSIIVYPKTKVGTTKMILTDKDNNKHIYEVESTYQELNVKEEK